MSNSDLRIKELCKLRGITQAELAAKIGIKPISFSQAIARNKFDVDYLNRIATALDVDIPELFVTYVKPSQRRLPLLDFLCPHCNNPLVCKNCGKPIKIFSTNE